MKITLYRTILCPRCFMASKHLRQLQKMLPEIIVEEIDVLKHPVTSWHDGIRMIPAVKIDNDILSGVYLTKVSIEDFVHKHLSQQTRPTTAF